MHADQRARVHGVSLFAPRPNIAGSSASEVGAGFTGPYFRYRSLRRAAGESPGTAGDDDDDEQEEEEEEEEADDEDDEEREGDAMEGDDEDENDADDDAAHDDGVDGAADVDGEAMLGFGPYAALARSPRAVHPVTPSTAPPSGWTGLFPPVGGDPPLTGAAGRRSSPVRGRVPSLQRLLEVAARSGVTAGVDIAALLRTAAAAEPAPTPPAHDAHPLSDAPPPLAPFDVEEGGSSVAHVVGAADDRGGVGREAPRQPAAAAGDRAARLASFWSATQPAPARGGGGSGPPQPAAEPAGVRSSTAAALTNFWE